MTKETDYADRKNSAQEKVKLSISRLYAHYTPEAIMDEFGVDFNRAQELLQLAILKDQETHSADRNKRRHDFDD